MKLFWTKEKDTPVDNQIRMVLTKMTAVGVTSEEYPKLISMLERLNKLKAQERREPISLNKLAEVVGNLTGILVIVIVEKRHVITSKALNLLIRPRGQ